MTELDVVESSIPEEHKKDFASGDILMLDSQARCRTIEDVNHIIANPFCKDFYKFTIPRFVEEDGVYTVNPEHLTAPFGIFWMSHKDGRKWIVGIKMNPQAAESPP